MATTKKHDINLARLPDDLKKARLLTEKEYRSLTNMVEVMIRDHCKLHNVAISEQKTFFGSENQ
ncbi:MAG: hypothetical protein WC856_26275 [Methylococcaceae bacterium]|jgi:hypothetical protein